MFSFVIDDLVEFGTDKNLITVVLNNRVRSENQMPWTEVQKNLGHSIVATLPPAPELFIQASNLKTPAILCQPDSMTTQQITKIMERITEHEAQRT